MPKPLTFGILYDFRNPPAWERRWADLYAETLEVIAWSEGAGFAGAWLPEHHGAEDGYMPAPLVTLAAVAARTRTIRIGSGVALAPLHHPVRFAEECAMLSILSGGRIEMALAIGYRRREYDAFGLDFATRGARFDEWLRIVRALWAGETVDWESPHFTLRGARVTPVPDRAPPLFIGAFAPRALERAARLGDGYFGNEEAVPAYLDALRTVGKDPASARVRLQALFTAVADDPEQAMEELAPHYHHANNAYGAWLAEDRGAIGLSDPALAPIDLATFKRSGILRILTPDRAVRHFAAMRERVPGLEHVALMMPPGLPPARFVHYADLFAREVIPAFA